MQRFGLVGQKYKGMKVIRGRLLGSSSGYTAHAVELSFDYTKPAPDAPDLKLTLPFSVRSIASDNGEFTIAIPDDVVPSGPISVSVFDPAGARLFQQSRDSLPAANELLQLNVQPSTPFSLDEHPDPFINAPEKFFGHLIARTGSATVAGRQVILFGKHKLATGAPDPIETILGIT